MVIQIDEAARKFHSSRKVCKTSCSDVVVHLLEATCRWPNQAPPEKGEPVPIDRVGAFRRNSPPPPPREFWMMNLDPAC